MNRIFRSAAFYIVVALVVLVVVSSLLKGGGSTEKLSLSEFEHLVKDGNVATAVIHDKDDEVKGELRESGRKYKVSYPAEYADELTSELQDQGNIKITVDRQKESVWLSLLFNFLPFVLLIGVFIFVMNSMQGGGNRVMQFGKAKPKTMSKDQPKVTFADVAGSDEAVEELQEIKEFLENPSRFQAMGAKIPKGVLLFGPPGTGKTLLARAVAGEAGVPFFSISGSDFVEMFVGVGASRVRDLFEQAKNAAPAIIFMDEIDAVGRHRGAGLGGGHDEREQTLNQLLVEMDGFDGKTGVILIAATNRPDILDPALLRPGRFDRQIVVDRPALEGRRAILNVHAKGKPLAKEIDLDVIARRTPGFTGADLANLMNEAALLAARANAKEIAMLHLDEGIDRVIAGPERRTLVMSEDDKRRTAFHEGGHALVGHVLPDADPVHKVSIMPRGRALGLTWSIPEQDKFSATRSELRAQLSVLMGGRTAEELVFGEPTTGAANDIERATEIARAMVTQYGMSDTLGPLQLGQQAGEVFLGRDFGHQANYSDAVAARIDEEIRGLVESAHREAREILTTHRDILDLMASELVEHETLDTDHLDRIMGHLPKWPGGDTTAAATRAATRTRSSTRTKAPAADDTPSAPAKGRAPRAPRTPPPKAAPAT